MEKRLCILHLGKKNNAEVRLFDDRTWNKVQKANAARRQVYTQSKYFSITLPDEYDDTIGYHSLCYSHYTSVTVPSTRKPRSPRKHLLRTHIEHSSSTSSTGILPKVCFFCDKVVKRIGKVEGNLLETVRPSGVTTQSGKWLLRFRMISC